VGFGFSVRCCEEEIVCQGEHFDVGNANHGGDSGTVWFGLVLDAVVIGAWGGTDRSPNPRMAATDTLVRRFI
jgi:hypothetical protein